VPDSDFVVVARTEALIAGYEQEEAIARARAYADAGADAILVHSRQAKPDEVLDFARAWQNRLPVVIVPTKYYRTPVSAYRRAGISTVIWANHNMRAAVATMQTVCARILAEESVRGIESEVASLDDVFDLLNYAELSDAEDRYLPSN
jgi:phosphoenolpyruvate phosphomutase